MTDLTPSNRLPFNIAILAGGKSARMGSDKAWLRWGNMTLLEHVLARVAPLGAANTFLIANEAEKFASLGLAVYADMYQDSGSLGGLHSAIYHSERYHPVASGYTLVLACDMPLVNADLLRFMIDQVVDPARAIDAVVPRYEGLAQCFHAVYHARCLATITDHLDQRRLKINRIYDHMATQWLDEAAYQHINDWRESFRNVNTPDDLAQLDQLGLSH